MNIGTKIGAKIAHFAEPEDMKMFTPGPTRRTGTTHGIPVILKTKI